MVDLSKLSPAPWQVWHDLKSGSTYVREGPNRHPILLPEFDDASCHAALEFAVLTRNVFEIMARRGWSFQQLENGQWVLLGQGRKGWLFLNGQNWFAATPYEAAEQLVEADRLLTEKEAKHGDRENMEAQT